MTNNNSYGTHSASYLELYPRYIPGNIFYRLFYQLRYVAERIWASRHYEPALVVLAATLLILSQTYNSCAIFLCITGFMLIFCSDILAVFMPFLIFCLFTTGFYEDYSLLLQHWPVFIMLLASLGIHFAVYRAPLSGGKMSLPLLAVSAAAVLGGVGKITASEYFAPVSVYYMLGLGAAMLCAYTLLLSQLKMRRNYNVLRRFLITLYYAGLFTGIVIVNTYLLRFDEFLDSFSAIYMSYRNFCATIMLVALPCVCIPGKNGKYRFGGLVFIYICLLFSGSRSGLIFGSAELVAILVWMYRRSGSEIRRRIKSYAPFVLPVVLAVLFFLAKALFSSRLVDGNLISPEDSRFSFFMQGIRDFLSAPVFGCGLGNMTNSSIFIGVGGSMVWYHNLVAQILGSMGLCGAAAFGWMYYKRFRLMCTKRSAEIPIAALSSIGMLLISMTNPGEFCPLPNALIMVALFAIIELLPERRPAGPDPAANDAASATKSAE